MGDGSSISYLLFTTAICQDPGTPEFGSREDNLEEFIPGMKVEYGCEVNTELTGSRERECLPVETGLGSHLNAKVRLLIVTLTTDKVTYDRCHFTSEIYE